MQDENMSRKELLAVRKQRKLEKRKVERRAEVISYIKKKVPIAILIVVGIVWCIVDLHINRPIIDEKDTYSYIGNCVEIEKNPSKASLIMVEMSIGLKLVLKMDILRNGV